MMKKMRAISRRATRKATRSRASPKSNDHPRKLPPQRHWQPRNAELVDVRFEEHESYAVVKWTFNQLTLYEKLQQIPFEQWHLEAAREAVATARAVSDEELNRRATEFIRQMLRDGMTQDTLQLAVPVPKDPAVVDSHKQRLLLLHCERISKELKAVEAYIVQ